MKVIFKELYFSPTEVERVNHRDVSGKRYKKGIEYTLPDDFALPKSGYVITVPPLKVVGTEKAVAKMEEKRMNFSAAKKRTSKPKGETSAI